MTENVLLTSKSEHWCTPPEILNLVNQVDTIGLDPCTNLYSIVGAQLAYDESVDGLMTTWQNKGLVYVNPPYGKKLIDWTKKIAAESLLGTEIIALTPARTDTKWFHNYILPYATSILFWKGRVRFIDGTTGKIKDAATFPSLVSYFGPRPGKFKKAFGSKGFLLEL